MILIMEIVLNGSKCDLVELNWDINETFWTPGISEGILSNRHCPSVHPFVVCGPSMVLGPSLDISETVHQFFLFFCIKLGPPKGTKVTEPNF